MLGERGWRVEDDHVVHPLGHPEQLHDGGAGDPVGVAGLGRRTQHVQAALVPGDDGGQALLVQVTGHGHHVGGRPLGHEREGDRDVTEREVEVDEQHPGDPVRGQLRRQVRRDRRLAHPALGGEDRDDPALGGAVRVHRAAEALGEVEAALARLHQRAQVVGTDDLAHSGAQRLGEHTDVEAPAHQHHADIGAGQPELLGQAQRRGQVDVRADDQQPLEAVLAEVADDRRA